jgi:hypothetical protein
MRSTIVIPVFPTALLMFFAAILLFVFGDFFGDFLVDVLQEGTDS